MSKEDFDPRPEIAKLRAWLDTIRFYESISYGWWSIRFAFLGIGLGMFISSALLFSSWKLIFGCIALAIFGAVTIGYRRQYARKAATFVPIIDLAALGICPTPESVARSLGEAWLHEMDGRLLSDKGLANSVLVRYKDVNAVRQEMLCFK